MSIQALNSIIKKHSREGAVTLSLSYFDFDTHDDCSIRRLGFAKLFESKKASEHAGILAKTAFSLLNSHATLAAHLSIEAKEEFDRRISSLF